MKLKAFIKKWDIHLKYQYQPGIFIYSLWLKLLNHFQDMHLRAVAEILLCCHIIIINRVLFN